MPTIDALEIEAVAAAAFRAVREMDTSCPTGLCNYVSVSPYAGKKRKDEPAITWGVTNALAKKWHVEQCEHVYPQGGGRCDRVLELSDGSRLWLEIKLAWRAWFYEVVKWNDLRAYNGYLGGAHHSHSVAGDFTKLERIGRDHAKYVALLVVGFDAADAKMSADMDALAKRENLRQRGWHLLSNAWATPQSARSAGIAAGSAGAKRSDGGAAVQLTQHCTGPARRNGPHDSKAGWRRAGRSMLIRYAASWTHDISRTLGVWSRQVSRGSAGHPRAAEVLHRPPVHASSAT